MKNKTTKLFSAVYFACIISCILLASYLVSDVFGRYYTETTGSDSARVAKWDVQVKDFTASTIELNESAHEGAYTFTIDNQSEVSVRCIVRVKFPSAPATGLTLTLGTQELNTDGINTDFVFTDAPIELGYSQSQSVTLTVATESFDHAIEIGGITVWVDAEQVN